MKIAQLDVQGFRTLRNISWKPGNLNVIIGPNGCGKSNLLKLLRLISMSAQGKLSDHVLKEGGMGSLVWDGHEPCFGFHMTLAEHEAEVATRFDYSLTLKRMGSTASYKFDKELLTGIDVSNNPPRNTDVAYLVNEHGRAYVFTGGEEEHIRLHSTEFESGETLLSQMVGPWSSAPSEIIELRKDLATWTIHDELRADSESEIRRPSTSRYDEHLESDGQNLTAVLHTLYTNDKEFKEDIDSTMSAAFGEEYNGLAFPPVGSQQVQLCVVWKSLKRPQPATSLSDGTLRFLQIITALAQPNPPALIAIDEPEAGLHPSMMPLIAEYAEDVALRSQVILTTHSAEFLSDFNKEDPPTVSVMELEKGETHLRVVDPEQLSYWLEDYSLGQLYESRQLEQMDGIEAIAA